MCTFLLFDGTLFLLLSLIGLAISSTDMTSTVIKLGVISSQHNVDVVETFPASVCNISTQLMFVDYSEEFRLFRAVHRLLDSSVDLILLHDLDPGVVMSPGIIDMENEKIITMYRQPKVELNPDLSKDSNSMSRSWTSQYSPHCITKKDMNWDRIWINSKVPFPEVLAKVIKLQRWKSVYILHDDGTAMQTRDLVNMLSINGTWVVIYNVDHTPDIHGTLMKLYTAAIKERPEFDIVILCKTECILRVLNTANNFDRINKNQTVLQLFSRWLVPVFVYNKHVSSAITTAADEINNLAILAIPEHHPPTLERIPSLLQYVMLDLNSQIDNETFTDGMNETVKEYFMRRLKENMSEWEPASTCAGYLFVTLIWTNGGRQFKSVGYARRDGEVKLLTKLYPNAEYGYSQRNFVVTTHHYPPWVIRRELENKTVIYEGAFIDLLIGLSKVLNFTYTMIDPPDDKWGSVVREVNGTPILNGMIGQLQRRECDIAAAPLAILPVRDKVVDFSYPVYHEYTTVVVKKPDPNAKKWKTLISPLKWQVLVAIVLALPVVTVILFIIEKYNPYYPAHKRKDDHGGLHHLFHSFWYMSGAMFYQGGVHLPDSIAGRTFVSSWWMFCMIVGGIYCGNLIAFLTVSKDVLPFNTLSEMVQLKDSYKWGTLGGTNWEIIFTSSNNSIIRKVGDAMMEFNKSDDVIFHLTTQAHIDRVEKGEYAFIGDVTSVGLAIAENCDFRKIKEEFLPMKNAFAFQSDSPHTILFSDHIMKSLEAGLLETWRRRWWPKEKTCIIGTKPEATPISLLDVQSAFYVCLIGWFLGKVVFIAEILYHKFRHRRSKTTE